MSELSDIIDNVIGQLTYARSLVPDITVGKSIQSRINAALPGITISIEPGVYNETIFINKSLKLVSSAVLPNKRAAKDAPVTIISDGLPLDITGDDVTISGIGFRSNDPSQQLIDLTGTERILLDRVVGIGGPQGQHRGVNLNGDMITLNQCFFDECWNVARDAQAVSGYDGCKNIILEDCYLGGGAQSFMFGGSTSLSSDRIPRNIKINNCDFSKNKDWYAKKAQIKCAWELKSVDNLTMTNCRWSYAGISEGQAGYLADFTVRSQSGKDPWSNVTNVKIQNCQGSFAGGIFNFLGSDNNYPSGTMENVLIENCTFDNIDPTLGFGNAGRCFLFQRAPKNITLRNIVITGSNLLAQAYFVKPFPVALVMDNIKFPNSKYGLKIDAGGSGIAALKLAMPDGIFNL